MHAIQETRNYKVLKNNNKPPKLESYSSYNHGLKACICAIM